MQFKATHVPSATHHPNSYHNTIFFKGAILLLCLQQCLLLPRNKNRQVRMGKIQFRSLKQNPLRRGHFCCGGDIACIVRLKQHRMGKKDTNWCRICTTTGLTCFPEVLFPELALHEEITISKVFCGGDTFFDS